MRKILISKVLDQIKIAIIDNNQLRHFFVEYEEVQQSIRGNIYKAKKDKNARGMDASFIDIGLGRSAFLSQYIPFKEEMTDNKSNYKISDKDELLVQAVSDYDPRKAPKVSDFIALPSKYCVIVSKPKFFGISKRIDNDKERKRFNSLKKLSNKDCGIILRTSSMNKKIKEIKNDITETKKKWRKILSDFKKNPDPGILHKENSTLDNIIREYINKDKIIIETDSRYVYNKLKKNPDKNIQIKLIIKNKEIFKQNQITDEIDQISSKKVKLKNGSFLLIEEKEGLTVIDINSGNSLNNKKETIFNVNKLAAEEISRQIVLRNLHGLILIDFIDLKKPKEKNSIFKTLSNNMKIDKSKHTILPMSKFGIIEMTRQKRGSKISNVLNETCDICSGNGLILKKDTICYEIIEKIIKENKKRKFKILLNSNLHMNMKNILKNHQNAKEIKKVEIKLIEDNDINLYKII